VAPTKKQVKYFRLGNISTFECIPLTVCWRIVSFGSTWGVVCRRTASASSLYVQLDATFRRVQLKHGKAPLHYISLLSCCVVREHVTSYLLLPPVACSAAPCLPATLPLLPKVSFVNGVGLWYLHYRWTCVEIGRYVRFICRRVAFAICRSTTAPSVSQGIMRLQIIRYHGNAISWHRLYELSLQSSDRAYDTDSF
jgi:hypothetical protein